MASALSPAQVKELAVVANDLALVRYIHGAALTLLIYDHVLCIPEEVQFIWAARWSVAKSLFLFNKYLVPISLSLVAHAFSDFSRDLTDTNVMSLFSVLGLLSISAINVVVVLRVIVLWDRRTPVTLGMLFVLFSTLVTAIVTMAIAASGMHAHTRFNPIFKICALSRRPPTLSIVWGSLLIFDISVLLLTVLNYLDRPRMAQGGLAPVGALYRDGLVFFVIGAALRVFTLVMQLIGPLQFAHFGPMLTWPLETMMLTRVVFNARRDEPDCLRFDAEAQSKAVRVDVEFGVA